MGMETEMMNLREIRNQRQQSFLIDWTSEVSVREKVSTMMPRFLACAAELPFTESENHGGAAGLNMLRLKFKWLCRSRA